jgi:4-alpha-glucanotransferase
MESSDLALKRGLGIDPGESDDARAQSRQMLRHLLNERADGNDDFAAVAYVLGQTPCRLVMTSIEDILGIAEQVNIPGTIDEHPNWRRKISVPLEALEESTGLRSVAAAFKAAGRDSR